MPIGRRANDQQSSSRELVYSRALPEELFGGAHGSVVGDTEVGCGALLVPVPLMNLGDLVEAKIEAQVALSGQSWMKRELVEPVFGTQPRGLSSMANPRVPGTGMRRTEARPVEIGAAPMIGS